MNPTHHESAPLLHNKPPGRNLGGIHAPDKLQPSPLFSSVAVRTRPGFNGYTLKTNQDSFVVDKCFNDNGYNAFLACFDGHGQFGHKVSQFLKRTICPNIINKIKQNFTNKDLTLETNEDVSKILIDSFVFTNNELNQKLSNMTELSGSTGVSV